MAKQANAYKIGLFVIIATIILVSSIILFGANAYFRKSYKIETYFDSSVDGLSVGSPVKYRGIVLGEVCAIDFIQLHYPNLPEEQRSYVYVQMDITNEHLVKQSEDEFREQVENFVSKGARIRMTSGGISGLAFLQLDYLNEEDYPVLEAKWVPKHVYIPSVPSRLDSVFSSMERIAANMEKVDVQGLSESINNLVNRTDNTIANSGIPQLIEDIRQLTGTISSFVDKPATQDKRGDINEIIDKVKETLETTHRVASSLESRIDETLDGIDEGVDSISNAAKSVEEKLSDKRIDIAIDKTHIALDRVPDIMDSIEYNLRRMDQSISSKDVRVDEILRNLEKITQDISNLMAVLEQYPSIAAFGEAPKPVEE